MGEIKNVFGRTVDGAEKAGGLSRPAAWAGAVLALLLFLGGALGLEAQGSGETALASAAPLAAKAPKVPNEFTAWVVTDLHYLAPSLHDQGARYRSLLADGDNKNIAAVAPLLDAFSWAARGGSAGGTPDCVIVTGDLTFNGEEAGHLDLAARFKALEAAGVDVYVLPGNHDIDNPNARLYKGDQAKQADTVDQGEFARIYGAFGFDEALDRDKDSLSYVARPRAGVRLLMLDSTISEDNLEDGFSEAGGAVRDSTRAWIRKAAAEAAAAGDRLVVAMHHSLVDHNALINENYTIDDAAGLEAFFSSLGVEYALSGHTHIQDVAEARTPSGPIYDITTGALSVYPHNYGVLRLSLDGEAPAADYSSRSVDVGAWARATGKTDPALLGFAAAAERFFRDHSERRLSAVLESNGICAAGTPPGSDPRPGEAEKLLDLLVTVNERFFCGKEELNDADLRGPEDVRLLALLPEGFLADYVRSIISDATPFDNSLRLP